MLSENGAEAKVSPTEKAWALAENNDQINPVLSESDVPSYYLTGIIPRATSAENSDDPNFIPINSKSGEPTLPKYDDGLRKQRQDASEFRYEIDPNYRAVIDAFLFFTIGTGFQVRARDENQQVQEYLDQFMAASKFDGRDQDIVLKALRSGECFIRFFTRNQGRPARLPVMRVYNYWEIKSIRSDPKDREAVTAYVRYFRNDGGQEETEDIAASEMIHVKVAEKDQERGTPPFDVIAQACQWYRNWLHNRVVFNRLKTSYYLEEIVKGGSPAQVSALDASHPDQDRKGQRGGLIKRMPKPGSKLVHNDAVEYKWLSPDVKADDAKEDGRAIRLAVCAGAQVPEFVLGDASNANYNSTMVAQNPFIRKVEFFRDHFTCAFESIFAWVIKYGIDEKHIPGKSTKTEVVEKSGSISIFRQWAARFNALFRAEAAIAEKQLGFKSREVLDDDGNAVIQKVVDTDRGVLLEWPNLIAQNLLQDSQAYQIHQQMGIASRETIAQRLGYEFEEEVRRLSKEAEMEDGEHFDSEDEEGVGGFGGKKRDKEIDREEDDDGAGRK